MTQDMTQDKHNIFFAITSWWNPIRKIGSALVLTESGVTEKIFFSETVEPNWMPEEAGGEFVIVFIPRDKIRRIGPCDEPLAENLKTELLAARDNILWQSFTKKLSPENKTFVVKPKEERWT